MTSTAFIVVTWASPHFRWAWLKAAHCRVAQGQWEQKPVQPMGGKKGPLQLRHKPVSSMGQHWKVEQLGIPSQNTRDYLISVMMKGWADPTQSTTAEVAKGPKRGFVWLWGDCSVVESNDGTKILEGSQQFSGTQGSRLRRCSHSACSNATAGTKRTRSRRSSSICQISWQFSCTKTKTPTTSNAWGFPSTQQPHSQSDAIWTTLW